MKFYYFVFKLSLSLSKNQKLYYTIYLYNYITLYGHVHNSVSLFLFTEMLLDRRYSIIMCIVNMKYDLSWLIILCRWIIYKYCSLMNQNQ